MTIEIHKAENGFIIKTQTVVLGAFVGQPLGYPQQTQPLYKEYVAISMEAALAKLTELLK